MNKVFTTLITAIVAVSPFITNAQGKRDDGKKVSVFHRLEISEGFTFGSAALNINDRYWDGFGQDVIGASSRAKTFNFRTLSSYVALCFPISYLSDKSILALNVGVYGMANKWDLGNTSLTGDASYEAKELYLGVPIGVDIIWGGEATCDKGDKVTLRAGAGVMPYFATGDWADGSNKYSKLGIQPYVKAEIGFFAGIEWKVRGMIVASSRTVYDIKVGDYYLRDSDYYYALNYKVRPTYTVGIALLPFSFGWGGNKW